ncbi:MAG: hypothetical protein ACLPH3_24630 [Terracidiphilus sp.]
MSDSIEQNPEASPAVTRCCEAMERAYRAVLSTCGNNEPEFKRVDRAEKTAVKAYREAMPPLSGCENIRNFIACVAQGLLLDVFSGSESTRLLYAAQVANSAAQNHTVRARVPAA